MMDLKSVIKFKSDEMGRIEEIELKGSGKLIMAGLLTLIKRLTDEDGEITPEEYLEQMYQLMKAHRDAHSKGN